jgi:hypothetical protein
VVKAAIFVALTGKIVVVAIIAISLQMMNTPFAKRLINKSA